MNKETIIRLAREAGLEILSLDGEDEVGCGDGYHIQTDLIERFAALVAAHERAAEREACAKVCDVMSTHPEYASGVTKLAAAAIRSRT